VSAFRLEDAPQPAEPARAPGARAPRLRGRLRIALPAE